MELEEALENVKKHSVVQVVQDDKAVNKLTAELNAMTKRAERYRSERDVIKKEFDAVKTTAERLITTPHTPFLIFPILFFG
jgi:hypothetical protein